MLEKLKIRNVRKLREGSDLLAEAWDEGRLEKLLGLAKLKERGSELAPLKRNLRRMIDGIPRDYSDEEVYQIMHEQNVETLGLGNDEPKSGFTYERKQRGRCGSLGDGGIPCRSNCLAEG